MSLRHLYIDINLLGIYPDLIDINRHGKLDIKQTRSYEETNKYYGHMMAIQKNAYDTVYFKLTISSNKKLVIIRKHDNLSLCSCYANFDISFIGFCFTWIFTDNRTNKRYKLIQEDESIINDALIYFILDNMFLLSNLKFFITHLKRYIKTSLRG